MVEARNRRDLVLESLPRTLEQLHVRPNEFHRNATIEFGVPRFEDNAHTAPADSAAQLVGPELPGDPVRTLSAILEKTVSLQPRKECPGTGHQSGLLHANRSEFPLGIIGFQAAEDDLLCGVGGRLGYGVHGANSKDTCLDQRRTLKFHYTRCRSGAKLTASNLDSTRLDFRGNRAPEPTAGGMVACKALLHRPLQRPTEYRTDHLVKDASRGDSTAVDELLERFQPELHAFLRFHMGREIAARESVSDLAQSVCREVLQDLSQFEYRGESSFKRWLFLQAQRKIASRGRFHAQLCRDPDREQPFDANDDFAIGAVDLLTPSRHAIAREDLAGFSQSVEALPEVQRRVLILCRGLGMSPAEAAAELGKTANAVRVALHRGLARLAVLLDAQESTEESAAADAKATD